jgi:pyroglutamyl-peptidase
MPRPHSKTYQSKPAVLLTGFGPFPGVADNVSGRLVEALTPRAAQRFPDFVFKHEVLATEWRSAPARVTALIDEVQPVLALHFGVASGTQALRIETRAENLCRLSDDAAGLPPLAPQLTGCGTAHRGVTIPAADIYQRLIKSGVPVSISDDCGGYLCNAVLYHSLGRARAPGRRFRSGFIHLPDDLESPPLTFSVALNACLEIIDACLADG